MTRDRGRRLAFGALVAAAVIAVPGAQAGPAPAGWTAPITTVQFRFPWETQRRPAKKPKRSAKPQQTAPRQAKPQQGKPPRDAGRPSQPTPRVAPGKREAAPLARTRPPGLLPVAASAAVVAGWSALSAQIPPPEPAPPLAPDGPAPAPASVVALMKPALPRAEIEDEDERDYAPLPPRRPGLAPAATADDAGAAAPPLPPHKPDDMRSAALVPKAPLPTAPPEPGAPDVALPLVAWEDDPDCLALEKTDAAIVKRIPSIEGPGVCGAGPLVELSGVRRRDGGAVDVKPAATLRCAMARVVVSWLRDDLAPAAAAVGSTLARLDAAGSYACRGRNNVAGGKMSEHGRANALDVAGFGMADGKDFSIYAKDMPETFASVLRGSACGRFNTVLGEGSDAAHATHLHVDMQPRKSRRGKLCQWEGDEEATPAKAEAAPAASNDRPAGEKPASEK